MLLWNRCFVVQNFWVLANVQYMDLGKKKNENKRRFCAQLGGFPVGWPSICFVSSSVLDIKVAYPIFSTETKKFRGAQFACDWTQGTNFTTFGYKAFVLDWQQGDIFCACFLQFVKCGFAGDNFPAAVFPCMVGRPMLRYEEDLGDQELKVKLCCFYPTE